MLKTKFDAEEPSVACWPCDGIILNANAAPLNCGIPDAEKAWLSQTIKHKNKTPLKHQGCKPWSQNILLGYSNLRKTS